MFYLFSMVYKKRILYVQKHNEAGGYRPDVDIFLYLTFRY